MATSLSLLLTEHPLGLHQPLVFSGERAHTRSDLLAAVDILAAELTGIAPGSPVMVIGDGIAILTGMFAAWEAGLLAVPVNPRLPPAALEATIVACDPAAVVRGGEVTRRQSDTVHPPGAALALWTSGTTGRPKPILHHHDAYLEIIDRVLEPLSATRDRTKAPSPNLIPVPMTLNAGIYNALFGLRAGSPLVLMDQFETASFAALVDRHRIRSTVLPPAAIVMLNADARLTHLRPLRHVRSITAPLSPFHARTFHERFGIFVLNGYGQAELGEVIGWSAADGRAHHERIGAVGRPHRGVSIRLDEPDSRGIGELSVRPPIPVSDSVRVTLGDRLGTDGYVRTGDLARVDGAGFVWIEGRLSEVINRGGNKVFPVEVEEILAAVAGVDDVAVVGLPDDRLGEVPIAFVVGEAEASELEDACRARLVSYKVPKRFERVLSIPRSEAGKILRRELTS